MPLSFFEILLLIVCLGIAAFWSARQRIGTQTRQQAVKAHSLSFYYGIYTALWTAVPAVLVLLIWTAAAKPMIDGHIHSLLQASYPKLPESFLQLKLAQLENIASGLLASKDLMMLELADEYNQALKMAGRLQLAGVGFVATIGFIFAWQRISPALKARIVFETFLMRLFFIAAAVAVLTTIGIIASLLFEAFRFFAQYSFIDFFFGTHWSPMIALREGSGGADEAVGGSSGSFGMIPVMAGTLLVAAIAMLVAVPIGLFSAIYMAEFASRPVRDWVKPTLEVLAGIPTVVYGFFAALTAAPFFRSVGLSLGMDVAAQSALAAGGVMGIMIIPFISSLSDDVIRAVPQSLRDGALGLGSTRGEMIIKVVLPAAFPGLVGAFLLAVSRAIGETMIVVMAAGVAAQLTINPLESVTTVTVQIVMLLTGDTAFDSLKTLSAFALGITLFFVTLILNIGALTVARKVGERYE